MDEVLFVECGWGCDQHGQDATKAVVRACRNAIEYNSIPSIRKIVPAGVSSLTHRQKLATAVAKAERAGLAVDVSDAAATTTADSTTTGKRSNNKNFAPLPTFVPPTPPISFHEFNVRQDKVEPGDTYKLEFPFSGSMLADDSRFGSEWLTTAFRAFGSINADTSVILESVKEFSGGGAASKALLTMPHEQSRVREKYLCACIYAQDGPEVTFAQSFYDKVPMGAPKTYFADRSAQTCNFIIITERLEYASEDTHPKGAPPSTLKPYVLQRAYSKFHDHYLGTDPLPYYLTLAKKLGQLGGWYKAGGENGVANLVHAKLPASDAVAVFGTGAQGAALAAKQIDVLVDFVTNAAPKCFPPSVRSAEYMRKFKAQFLHMLELSDGMADHLKSSPDYFALAHPNLNIDNAYWWTTVDSEDGTIDCGLIDWAGVGVQSITAALDMSLMSGGWAVQAKGGQRQLLSAYAHAYAAGGGPTLDVDDMQLRFDMTLALSLPGQVGVPPQLYKRLKKEEWPSVESAITDPRIDGDGDDAFLLRSYLGNLVYRMERWQADGVYERICAWAKEPPAKGAT